jgi:small subunit ribosomal protein S18
MANTTVKKRKFKKSKPRTYLCEFDRYDENYIDYKNVALLEKYISSTGQILSRKAQTQHMRASGEDKRGSSVGIRCCAKHQRTLTLAIKRARHMALLPFTKD